jgi:Uma2 family endonuclease
VLTAWAHDRDEISVLTNEAGMKLGDDVRAADAAVWRAADLPDDPDVLPRRPPLLAVEVAGRDDTEPQLRTKAAWYREHGVPTVWILLPTTREALVIADDRELRFGRDDRLPSPTALDDLSPTVASLFRQVSRARP